MYEKFDTCLKIHKAKFFKLASTSLRCPHCLLRYWICNKKLTTLAGLWRKVRTETSTSLPHSSQFNIGFVVEVHFWPVANHYLVTTVISSPVSPRKFLTNTHIRIDFIFLSSCISLMTLEVIWWNYISVACTLKHCVPLLLHIYIDVLSPATSPDGLLYIRYYCHPTYVEYSCTRHCVSYVYGFKRVYRFCSVLIFFPSMLKCGNFSVTLSTV
jgi:hypothetical protein